MEETSVLLFEDFERAYISMSEVQRGASRIVNGQRIKSLPLDMDIELSDAISKAYTLYKPINDHKVKLMLECGGIQDRIKGIVTVPDEISESLRTVLEDGFEKIKTQRIEVPFLPLKLFTLERLRESQIELDDCPSRQAFFAHCVKK